MLTGYCPTYTRDHLTAVGHRLPLVNDLHDVSALLTKLQYKSRANSLNDTTLFSSSVH